ncbi:DUF3325 domain-containing protein [Variovorax saccharolyticus]|uniref:DUF3325 domain-containing protein n=1 Tax=Variovorax saccharolyticus TaxID=3053516 RepID=UPI0025751D88|nr:DUF3325 domain-containing protein [Variovorax sp. J22R187]MDM0019338.1 DUF3325 domain-containing protein [Variovorax sp. J22R187]
MTALNASMLALGLGFAGMSALAFAMDRHYAQLTQQHEVPGPHRLLLRTAALILFALACAPCIAAWGGSVGTAAFIGFLSAGALPVALLLPWQPRLVAGLATTLALSGLAFMALGPG